MLFSFRCLACCCVGLFVYAFQYVYAESPVIQKGVVAVAAGNGFTAYIEANGSLYCSGNNDSGQLGDGSTVARSTFGFVTSDVSRIACGTNYILFVKTNGSLWGIGDNYFGQLGDGSNTGYSIPKQILDSGVADVSVGTGHSLILKTDGSLWSVGLNISGQLGTGNTIDRTDPFKVVDFGVDFASAGENHSLFVKSDGSLWGMGSSWAGALGDGNTTDISVPFVIVNSGVVSASAGGNHSLFVKSDGSLWGMGYNAFGQIGDASNTDRLSPVQVLPGGVSSVFAGANHTLILKTDGSLWSMGRNSFGQLGDGSTIDRNQPVAVEPSGVTMAVAASEHSIYSANPDLLKMMGRNHKGGFGNGSTDGNSSPVTVLDGELSVVMSEDGNPNAWNAPPLFATDADGDILSWSVSSEPSFGSASVAGTGASPSTIDYVPDGNFSGTDSFVVQVSDGVSADTITINVEVEPVSDSPVIEQGDSVSVTMSQDGFPVSWVAPTLSSADAEGDFMTWFFQGFTSTDAVDVNGTVSLEGNGSSPSLFNYVPSPGFVGIDSFEIGVTDGTDSALITVSVTILAVNAPPFIDQGDAVSIISNEGQTLSIVDAPTLSAEDPEGSTLTWSLSSHPLNGIATLGGTGASPTSFSYVPDPYFYGTDSFVIMVSDGDLNDTVTVNLSISGVNDAPVVAQGTEVAVTMSENGSPTSWSAPSLTATDPDGDSVLWTLLSAPLNGTATVSGTGESPSTFVYDPNENFSGEDSFTIRVSDGTASTEIDVNVVVEHVNVPPVINQRDSVVVIMSEDSSPNGWIAPTLEVTDPDNSDTLTWSVKTPPVNGIAAVSGTGTSPAVFSYVPNENFWGTDSFLVQVSDGNASDSISVVVSVSAVNDAPVVAQGGQLSVGMSENGAPVSWVSPSLSATDVDGDSLTWSIFSLPSNGTSEVSGEGGSPSSFNYSPNTDFSGTDSFVVMVGDGNVSVPVAINVLVGAVNDYPVLTRGVARIATGTGFSLYLDANGTLYSSGTNSHGQLGDGSMIDRFSFVPISSDVKEIAAGNGHSLFVKSDGSLWAMGNNAFGQLGDGTFINRAFPVPILPSGVSFVCAGENHSLFIKEDGSLWSMGNNQFGQLGDSSLANRNIPVEVLPGEVSFVSAGYSHSLVVKADSSLWAMGSNAAGAFGDDTTTDSIVPSFVANNVSSVSAGRDYSLILKVDGSLHSVGENSFGQLGDGGTNSRFTLSQVVASGVRGISAGLNGSSFFLMTNGSLWAMGNNQFGQLGDGSTVNRTSPVQIELVDVLLASAGGGHSLYTKRDGSLWGMGFNENGALGDGSSLSPSSPFEIYDGALELAMNEDDGPLLWLPSTLFASDEEGDVLTWSMRTAPSYGSLSIGGVGSTPTEARYSPDANFFGSDSFIVQVSDGLLSAPVTVNIAVLPQPDSPIIAQGDSVSVTMSEESTYVPWVAPVLTASDNDGDSLAWSLSSPPSNGVATVSGTGENPSVLHYAPNLDFEGTDSFVVEVSDGNLTDLISVNVVVSGVPDTPSLSANFALSVIMSEDGAPTPWTPPFLSAADPDAGDTLSWTMASSPKNGIAQVGGTGPSPSVFEYLPNSNYSGSDSFVVRVSDGNSSDEVTVQVTIIAVDDPPIIAQSDTPTITMSEDGFPVSWVAPNLSATTPDSGEVLTWSLSQQAANGNATISGVGLSPSTFSYSPNANWSGNDSFVVKVDDGSMSDTLTVNVIVESVNDAPVVNEDGLVLVSMSEDSFPVAWVPPIISASDPDGDVLSWSLSRQASNGVSFVSGIGSSPSEFNYSPNPNYKGNDSFDILVSDGNLTSIATVQVNVGNINDAPVIVQGQSLSLTMSEDGAPVQWNPPILVATDSDPNDVLSWSAMSSPLHGFLEISGQGYTPNTFTYTPFANWHGSDVFAVKVSDGNASATISINVTVEPVDDTPVISEGDLVSVIMSEDGIPSEWISPSVTATDVEGEKLVWSLSGIPSNGTATVSGTGESPAVFNYQPVGDYSGDDNFTIKVSDGNLTDEIIVKVQVLSVNDPPLVEQGSVVSVTMSEDGNPFPWFAPSLTASDKEQDLLVWDLSSQPLHGEVLIGGVGSSPKVFLYEPNSDYAGVDTFQVSVTDGTSTTPVDVSVTISRVNDPPVISQGTIVSATMSEDGSPFAWVPPVLTASDADGDELSWSVVSQPEHATAVVDGVGSSPSEFSYIPDANFWGTDTFVVQVSDGTLVDEILVGVNINPVNDSPVIDQQGIISVTMNEDGSPLAWHSPTLTATDHDPSDVLVWSVSENPSNGVVSLSGSGKSPSLFSYQPYPNYAGLDRFAVRVWDGNATDEITVEVEVKSINDAPLISQGSDVAVTMSEDGFPISWKPPVVSASDSDSNQLTWSLLTHPAHGSAVVSGLGSSPSLIVYEPTPNFSGTDSFVIKVSDGNKSDEITINLTINSVKDVPVIAEGALIHVSMSEDGVPVAWVPPELTASDNDGDLLTWDLLFSPNHGIATVGGVGSAPSVLSYVPNDDFAGTDRFAVKVSDGIYSAAITIEVNVVQVNDAPVISEGEFVDSTMSVNGFVLPWSQPKISARDVDGDALTWSLRKSASNGSVAVEGFGGSPSVLVYSPEANFVGEDSFEIEVSDGSSSDFITINVDVVFIENAPVIAQGSFISVAMSEDSKPHAWEVPSISAFDLQGDELSWSLSVKPLHGSAFVSGTGSSPSTLLYEPDPDYFGFDSFVARVSDGTAFASILIKVTIAEVNDAPVFTQDSTLSVVMSEDGNPVAWTAPELVAIDTENDILSWSASIQPNHGVVSVSGTGNSPDTFSYQPTPDYVGSDSFTIQVSDGNATAEIDINVSVEATNDPPVITQGSSLSVTMSEDGNPVSWIAPELSAEDVESEVLSWSVSSPPSHGEVSVSGLGIGPETFTYQPFSNYIGLDTFTVQVNDGNATDEIVVNVSVEPINDAPVITQGSSVSVAMSEDGNPVSWVAPELSAEDVESEVLSWSVSSSPSHGEVSVSGVGIRPETFTYQPFSNYMGLDTFTVQVNDGNATDEIVVNVSVLSTNDAPVITQGSFVSVTMSEDGRPVSWVAPELSAEDVEGDVLTWSVFSQPSHGEVSVRGVGRSPEVFTYQPSRDYTGFDNFTVQVSDGNSSSRITVEVTVTEVSDLPPSFEFEKTGSFFENDPEGTTVGRFFTTEVSGDSDVSFSLVNEENNGTLSNAMFSLDVNGTLQTNESFNYEENSSYIISVRLSNSFGEFIDKKFSIALTDVFLPIVRTISPTSVGATFATMHGCVDDSGDDPGGVADRGFAIGLKPDPKIGSDKVTLVDSGFGMGSFSAIVDGLLPGTKYYYRSYAENSEGRRYGAQKHFFTTEHKSFGAVGGSVDRSSGWWSSGWFGDFYIAESDWIYHSDFGWLFIYGDDPSSLWFWQRGSGWLWSSNSAFPYLYSVNSANWLLWKRTEESKALFFDYSQSIWITKSILPSP